LDSQLADELRDFVQKFAALPGSGGDDECQAAGRVDGVMDGFGGGNGGFSPLPRAIEEASVHGICQEGGLLFVRVKIEMDLGEADGIFFEDQDGWTVFRPGQSELALPRHFFLQISFHTSFFSISSSLIRI
jgi:hypothetical protein